MENKLFAPLGTLQWMDTPDCCKTGLYDYRRIPSMDCFWRRAAAVYAWREGAYCYR